MLAGESNVLYIGMTNNLIRRIGGHKQRKILGYTQKYTVTKLVSFEAHGLATSAIACEKQIKGSGRAKRVALIEATNPHWKELIETLQRDSSLATATSE
jgi:putative endonuclease